MNQINRRFFLKGAGVAGLTLAATAAGTCRLFADPDPPADAKAPTLSPDPETYPFLLGGTEAFIINDGVFMLPALQPMFAPEAKPEEVAEMLKKNFLAADHFPLSFNVLVLKAKSGVMIFDAGAGGAFGANAGRLKRGLAKIGIAPEDVKSVYITHAHADHIGGLVDAENKPAFLAAKIYVAQIEADFWTGADPDTSGMRIAADARGQFLGTIKKMLEGAKPNIVLVKPGRLSPEVELIPAHGHTPGHAAFQVTVGGEKLLVLGDAVHIYPLQFPHPEWTMAYDTNPNEAIRTRQKLFKHAAADRTLLLAYHLPFPGIGHVREVGAGYEWVPRAWVV